MCQPSISKTMHFSSIELLVEQDIGRIIIPAMYQRLGIEVIVIPLPANRAQQEAVLGDTDGEIMRIWSYGIDNPDMIRVPTAYYYLQTGAFIVKNSDVLIRNKTDLAQYRLARVRGVKHTNSITAGLPFVNDMSNTQQMMRYLSAGMVDVALTNIIDGQKVIKNSDYKNIILMTPPLATYKLYHYLNKKHAALVSKIDLMIRDMQTSGELAQLIAKANAEVMNSQEVALAQMHLE
jgi:hypothetical protein